MPPSRDKRRGPLGPGGFDAAAAAHYDAWFGTPAGRYAEELENELVRRVVGDLSGRRVLDVGCGTGLHLKLFADGGGRGVGLEPSWEMLARAQERLQGSGVYLVQGRAEALPFRDDVFDVVAMITSAEFVADARGAFAEAARVCAGRLVVAVLNAWSISAAVRRLKRNVKATLFRAVRFYGPLELRRVLRAYLARPAETASTLHFFPFYRGRLRRALAAADRWLTRRGGLFGAFLVAWGDVGSARA